jgi:hypothetical protein
VPYFEQVNLLRFGGTFRLHLQCRRVIQGRDQHEAVPPKHRVTFNRLYGVLISDRALRNSSQRVSPGLNDGKVAIKHRPGLKKSVGRPERRWSHQQGHSKESLAPYAKSEICLMHSGVKYCVRRFNKERNFVRRFPGFARSSC